MLQVNESVCTRWAARALVLANVRYWLSVAPRTRRELRHWERRAHTIPDEVLRVHALAKLRDERFNAEVAATLATLAPLRHRARVVVAAVAFQVMYDYLDALCEQPVAEPLCNGRRLFRAFDAALATSAIVVDFYAHHPQRADGGYLAALASACRTALERLPAAHAVLPTARLAAKRCGEAQTRTHAIPQEGTEQLARWSSTVLRSTTLQWWEVAAGSAASVLSVHALIAAAAEPHTTVAEAEAIDRAYLPICAVTTLLDSLVDHEADEESGSHVYISYYRDDMAVADGLSAVTQLAVAGTKTLRHPDHHLLTLVGAAAYYLSAPGAQEPFARPTARRLTRELRPLITPCLGIFRVWRFAKRVRAQG